MPRFTRREDEVFRKIGQGLRSKQIADALGISEFTGRKHRASIIRKLGFLSSAQLIAHAIAVTRGHASPQARSFLGVIRRSAAA